MMSLADNAENFNPGATVEVTGLYLNKYQEIVRPNQRFLISNYFIHYWLRKLGPTLAWIIVSLQQACWRADNDSCTVSQTVIADEIGLTDRTIRKVLKNHPLRHWFIPEIEYQPGTFNPKKNSYQPLPNRYTVYLSSPLIPEHLTGLYGYLQTVCPAGQPDCVDQAIQDLLNRKSKESLLLLEEYASQVDHSFDRPVPLTEVVTLATGLDLEALPRTTAKTLTHNLDKLQTHLTEIGNTICRQYFRLTWVPLLGPALAWLIIIMRSRCYYNPETEELRDTYTWRKKELAETLGQSTKNLSNLLSHPQAGLFCRIIEQNKRKITVRVTMVYDPLASEELQESINQDVSFQKNRKKVPVTDLESEKSSGHSSQNQKKIPVTPSENRKKVPVTDLESEKSSGHSSQNRKKVPPCKYFKKSVPIVDKDQKDTIQNNVVVADNNLKDKIRTLLINAGLSGTGLNNLCNKNPPLDLRQIQAVLLYAEAHNLGPGYIYRHLESDDTILDESFLEFAALDQETLALFREAVHELRINGTFVSEIRTPIPEVHLDLFARFTEIFTGIAASRVVAIVHHDEHLPEQHYAGKPVLNEAIPAERIAVSMSPEQDALNRFWQQALGQLQMQMTQGTFETWVKSTSLVARNGLCFTIRAKNGFAKDWLENRLFKTIQRTIASLVRSENSSPAVKDIEIEIVVES